MADIHEEKDMQKGSASSGAVCVCGQPIYKLIESQGIRKNNRVLRVDRLHRICIRCGKLSNPL